MGGDVSGIQSYIYDIVSKSAAKNLKGRSFYVQLLVDSIIQAIINELNLFSANVIYSSGGGFYLLAPNTEETLEKLNNIRGKIEEKILEKHGTRLYLAIATEAISTESIIKKEIHKNWKNLTEKLNEQKRRRFSNNMDKLYDTFFEPSAQGASTEHDAITGEEIPSDSKKFELTETETGKRFILPYTQQQIRLGKMLKNSDYWISADEALNFIPSEFEVEVCDLGIYNYFLPETKLNAYRSKIRDYKGKVRIFQFNNLNFLDPRNGIQNIFGFNLYGGNQYPTEASGEPLTFDRFAGEGELKRLGYLRMDVDNLGRIFAHGFADENRTFSRYSVLSRNLDYFFRGYLNTLWKQEKYRNASFIIYSGGDDLFLVGKWDLLIELAEEIRDQFKAWTCHNPELSISGGIAIVDEKFPVLKSADFAGEEEERAKNHKISDEPGLEKNAFSLLGMPLNWDTEYPFVKKLKNQIASYFREEKLPRSFASKLHHHFASAEIREHKITNLRINWMLVYDFSRLAGTIKDEDAKSLIHDIKNYIFTNNHPELGDTHYHVFELINLATRWAELELRTNK